MSYAAASAPSAPDAITLSSGLEISGVIGIDLSLKTGFAGGRTSNALCWSRERSHAARAARDVVLEVQVRDRSLVDRGEFLQIRQEVGHLHAQLCQICA